MILQKDKVDSVRSSRVLEELQKRLNVKSKSELARLLGLAPSTLLRQETNGELPYRQLIELAEINGWSMDELLCLKESGKSQSAECLTIELMIRYVAIVVRVSEKYLTSAEIKKRDLGDKKIASLRIELAKILMELAITTQGNEAAVDLACRSILTINSA